MGQAPPAGERSDEGGRESGEIRAASTAGSKLQANASASVAEHADSEGESSLRDAVQEAGVAVDAVRAQVLDAVETRLFGGLSQPFRIGRFTVLEQLGMGGMGVVYTAFDPHLERQIAIKVLRGDHAGETAEPARARLLREAQAMARLSHPNVISVYEVGEFDQRVYIAMEFVRGLSLRRWLEAQSRSTADMLDVFVQAGRGLAAAHDGGVIHRDFKPDNVLVGDDGRVRVLDFGLAARDDGLWQRGDATRPGDEPRLDDDPGDVTVLADAMDTTQLTRDGALLGTPYYMAPEQHAGDPVDARSDQFSFCVALYRAAYGDGPFGGRTPEALATAVLGGEIRTPVKLGTRPRRLWKLLARGLARDPERRYPSMAELLAELEPLAHRRRRILVGAALGGAGVLAIGIVVGSWSAEDGGSRVCRGLSSRLDELWSPSRQTEVSERLDALGRADAVDRVHELVAEHVASTRAVASDICSQAPVSEDGFASLACVERRLGELETMVQLHRSIASNEVDSWSTGFANVESSSVCKDRALAHMTPRPHLDPKVRREVQEIRIALSRARAHRNSGKHLSALEMARTLRARVMAVGDPAIEAEWQLFMGESAVHRGALDAATEAFDAALSAAERSGHGRVKAEVTAAKVNLVGFHLGAGPETLETFFEALPGEVATEQARLKFLEAKSLAKLGRGQYEAAVEAGRAALAFAREHEGLDPAGAAGRLAFALVLLGEYTQALQVLDSVLLSTEQLHPQAIMVFGVAGLLRGYLGQVKPARVYFDKALAAEAALDERQPHFRGMTQSYMAYLLDSGPDDHASLALQRAALQALVATWGPKHPTVGRARLHLGNMLVERDQFDAARNEFEIVQAIWQGSHGHDHRVLARPETGIGLVHLESGRPRVALDWLERAHRRLAESSGHRSEDARTRFALARALDRLGRDRSRRRELARAALDAYEGLGPGFATERRSVRKWLATQTRSRSINGE